VTQTTNDPKHAAFVRRATEAYPTLAALGEALRSGSIHSMAEEMGIEPELIGAGIELPSYGGAALTPAEIRRHLAWSWDATSLLVGESPEDVKVVPRP
jgi:hypothetical protein